MNTFTYEFEELPLAIVNGIPAALINGCADIIYYPDGKWKIDAVCVEGHQKISTIERAAGKRPWVYVPAPYSLDRLIIHRLEFDDEWRDKVSSAVSDQLVDDRASDSDTRADIIRNRRMEVAWNEAHGQFGVGA